MSVLKKVDSYVCHVLAFIMSILPRNPKLISKKLIIRPGGMGDLICLHISLEQLNINLHDHVFLIEKRSKQWAMIHNLNHFCYDDASIFNYILKFRSFKTVINTEQLFGLSSLAALFWAHPSGIINGFNTNKLSYKYSQSITYDSRKSHEVIEFSKLFSNTPLSKNDFIRQRKHKADSYSILFLSGSNQPSRQLDLLEWKTFIKKHLHHDELVYVTGSPNDWALVDLLVKELSDQASALKTNFANIVNKVKNAKTLYTLDGGPVHIASYYGVPTICLFTSGIEKKWSPLANHSKYYYPKISCHPCTHFGQTPPCKNDFACKNINNYDDNINFETVKLNL